MSALVRVTDATSLGRRLQAGRQIARIAAMLAAGSLLVGFVSPGAAAASNSAGWMPALRSSETLSGPILASGRLVTNTGAPAAGQVIAMVWPTNEVLAGLKVGDPVETVPIAKTTADQTGAFVLRVDPSIPMAEYLEKDGTLNFNVVAVGAGTRGVLSMSRRNDSASGQWRAVTAGSVGADASETPAQLTVGTTGAGPSQPGVPLPAPASNRSGVCPGYVVATYNSVPVAIGETYAGPHDNAQFVYTNGSSSSLGVGYSYGGTYGSFSQNGTSSSSSTTTLTWPAYGANSSYIYETTFQYQDVHSYVFDGVFCEDMGYWLRATEFQGAAFGYTPCCRPTVSYSSYIQGGVLITKATASAVTWSNGVNMSPMGINLSSQTGYNTNTEIRWQFDAYGGYLVGDTASYPNAHRVVGK
jgi:hypothetical protein